MGILPGVAMWVLLYGYTTWTQTLEKKLDGNYASFEEILEAAPYKTSLRSLTSNLASKASKTC